MNREWIPETIGASYAPRRSALLSVITITVHLERFPVTLNRSPPLALP
jgi:hypothetical protein